jgi:hypothetical protein
MKYLFSVLGVAGLALLFGLSDPAPAATERVTPENVRLVSEQVSSGDGALVAGRNANMRGIGGGRARGSYCR